MRIRGGKIGMILLAAFLFRLLIALPGLWDDPLRCFSRPDSPGYLGPALALSVSGEYLTEPGGEPDSGRAPGFPFFVSGVFNVFSGESRYVAVVAALILIGTATTYLVYWIGRTWFGERAGLWAAGLHALNLTAVANTPMLLSDTLFAFLAGWQLLFFLWFFQTRKMYYFLLCAGVAGLGALTRPINSVWILPALFLVAVMPGEGWKRKIGAMLGGGAVFLLVLFPWMARNAYHQAGYCIDTNTGAMYHQNGAMILAAATGESYESHKQRILTELETEFADKSRYPTPKSQVDYRLSKLKEIIRCHPLIWIRQHFNIAILLPDAPMFLENLGLTRSDRGTMNVLHQRGIWAAANHYFEGRWFLPLLLLPLLVLTLAMYASAAWQLGYWGWNWTRCYWQIFLFLAFVEYYFFLPGPITMPRYQLPALILLCVMAGRTLSRITPFGSVAKISEKSEC